MPAITQNRGALGDMAIEFVRNRGRGAHGAVLTGFAASNAPFVVVYPADDDYNAGDPRPDARRSRKRAATSFAPAVSWLEEAWSAAPG